MTAPIHAHPTRKLGKRQPIPGRRAVRFGEFVRAVPPVPLADEPVDAVDFAMDLNDQFGTCVVAGFDHARQTITGLLTGHERRMTRAEIIEEYRTQNPGFDPTLSADNPRQEDNGMVIQTYLEHLVASGEILGFGKIDQSSEPELKAAVYLGLAIMIGVDLRRPQQDQTVWDDTGGEDWGGHCVPWVGWRGSPDYLTCVTWAALLDMTQRFVRGRCDEAWFILLPEHVAHPGFREGFDLEGFAAAVSDLTDGKVVVPTTPPAPAPGPPPFSVGSTLRWLLGWMRRLLGLG